MAIDLALCQANGSALRMGAVRLQRENGHDWTVQSLLDEMAKRGARPAVIAVRGEAVGTASFLEVSNQARRLASGLVAQGVQVGEPVALYGENSIDWILVRLALGAAGALVVFIDDLAGATEAGAILRLSGAQRVFCSAKHSAQLRQVCGEQRIEIYRLSGHEDAFVSDRSSTEGVADWRELSAESVRPLPKLDPRAPAMLLYTSGTTGEPKGFALSCANIWANIGALVSEDLLGPDDRLLLPLPLHHVYPQVIGLFTPLACGAAVVLPESVAGPHLLHALKAADGTGIIGVPRLYGALISALESRVAARGMVVAGLFRLLLASAILARRRFGLDLGHRLFGAVRGNLSPKLRLLVSGGARLEPDVLWKLVGLGWEVRSGYGLAETTSTFTGNLPGRERLGSEGKPFQGGQVRIVEPDERGEGEIELRGPNVFEGYKDNPEATRAAFTADGWFRTGDLGRLDPDGFLYVTGRAKEMIVLGGGKNVFPEKLERIFGGSASIREIALLERSGALVALVVPDLAAIRAGGYTRVDDVLSVTLRNFGQQLPSYQRLAGFAIIREPLPRTRLGKLRRFLLPQLYERALAQGPASKAVRLSAADRALLDDPKNKALWDLLAARSQGKGLSMEADLELDLGIDSLEWIGLSLELESRLGLQISDDDRAGIATVRDLLALTSRLRSRGDRGAVAPAKAAIPETMTRWLAPTGFALAALGFLLFLLNRLLMRFVFRVSATGLEHLPASGAVVVAANHASDLDPLVVASVLSWRQARRVYWGGDAQRLFARRWSRFLCRAAHVFPMDGRQPAISLALAGEVLARGHILVWFPEEWRSPSGEIQHFQPGIGWLLKESDSDVVPTYISGTWQALPRHRTLPSPTKVGITFGAPVAAAALVAEPLSETPPNAIADSLREVIVRLAGTD